MNKQLLTQELTTNLPLAFKRLSSLMAPHGNRHLVGMLMMIARHENRPMSFYSERLMIPRPNLTKMADRLIQDGFIERVPDPQDRRSVHLQLTDAGRAQATASMEEAQRQLFGKLSRLDEKELCRFNELIEELFYFINRMDGKETEQSVK